VSFFSRNLLIILNFWLSRNVNIRSFFLYLISKLFSDAGSAGFAGGHQLGQDGNFNYALFIFILCEWNTACTLLFKPLENGEKEEIKKELEVKMENLFEVKDPII